MSAKTQKKHGVTVDIIQWHPTHVWRARCDCKGGVWTGPTYEATEDQWREHVYASTGMAPKPLCDTTIPRWTP